jgi:hypothetical protein
MRIIALAFLLCVASVIEAAQMPLSVLPGGAVVFKPIQSVRERKFSDLVQQKNRLQLRRCCAGDHSAPGLLAGRE